MASADKLIEGYKRFRDGFYEDKKELLLKLAHEGQSPKTLLIACCDSRVDTSIIFDCEPGDLFVVRNVANLVPPCESDEGYHGTSAAIEFAVTGLHVENIIILGHTDCGGIKALVDHPPSEDKSFIGKWMRQLEGVRNGIVDNHNFLRQDERYRACEQHSIINSIQNLMDFPFVAERVNKGELAIHGWYYDIYQSKLFTLHQDGENFESI